MSDDTGARRAERITHEDQLPLVLNMQDLAHLADTSTRTIERWKRARKLPEPLIDCGRPRWAKAEILKWLNGGARRGRRT